MRTPPGSIPMIAALILTGLTACTGDPAPPARPDLLLITVDSLRADRPGFAGGPAATPAMDRLAGEGIHFAGAYTTAPQALPALASLHTGLYPARHGAREEWLTRVDGNVESLAQRLGKAGYRTAAFAASMSLHPKHGLNAGFDTYGEAFERIPRLTTSDAIGIPGKRIGNRALEWLTGLGKDEPFFLWINFFDTHYFHDPESPFKEKHPDSPYDAEVAMVDAQIDRVLSWLEDHDRGSSTLVILTGNHGEGLGEGGEQYYGLLLGESTLRVPLVIRPPGGLDSARLVADPVSLVDVAPTALELLGIEATTSFDGISLASHMSGEAAGDGGRALYFETLMPRRLFGWAALRGVRKAGLKYVEAPGTGWRALYDLEADPLESRDLSEERADDLSGLADAAGRLGGAMATEREAPGPDLAAEISALGFSTEAPEVELELPTANVDVGNAALQARRSLQRRMMRSALFLLNDVLANDPDNYVVKMDMATLSIGIGQGPTADGHLRDLQALYPADGEIYHQLGHVILSTDTAPASLERAGKLFEIAAALAPLNEEALYDSACATSRSDPQRAMDYLARAVQNGFRDFDHMSRDPDMDPLRGMDGFDELVLPPQPPAEGAGPVSPAESP